MQSASSRRSRARLRAAVLVVAGLSRALKLWVAGARDVRARPARSGMRFAGALLAGLVVRLQPLHGHLARLAAHRGVGAAAVAARRRRPRRATADATRRSRRSRSSSRCCTSAATPSRASTCSRSHVLFAAAARRRASGAGRAALAAASRPAPAWRRSCSSRSSSSSRTPATSPTARARDHAAHAAALRPRAVRARLLGPPDAGGARAVHHHPRLLRGRAAADARGRRAAASRRASGSRSPSTAAVALAIVLGVQPFFQVASSPGLRAGAQHAAGDRHAARASRCSPAGGWTTARARAGALAAARRARGASRRCVAWPGPRRRVTRWARRWRSPGASRRRADVARRCRWPPIAAWLALAGSRRSRCWRCCAAAPARLVAGWRSR